MITSAYLCLTTGGAADGADPERDEGAPRELRELPGAALPRGAVLPDPPRQTTRSAVRLQSHAVRQNAILLVRIDDPEDLRETPSSKISRTISLQETPLEGTVRCIFALHVVGKLTERTIRCVVFCSPELRHNQIRIQSSSSKQSKAFPSSLETMRLKFYLIVFSFFAYFFQVSSIQCLFFVCAHDFCLDLLGFSCRLERFRAFILQLSFLQDLSRFS